MRRAKKNGSLLVLLIVSAPPGCGDEASVIASAGSGGSKAQGETVDARVGEPSAYDAGGHRGGGSETGSAEAGAIINAIDGALPIDAAVETSQSVPSCAGVFCEDFEQGQLDPAKWNVQIAGGATTVVQQRNVAHGKYAAQFHGLGVPAGGASSAYVYLITKAAPASLLVHNFGRAYSSSHPNRAASTWGWCSGARPVFPSRPTFPSPSTVADGSLASSSCKARQAAKGKPTRPARCQR